MRRKSISTVGSLVSVAVLFTPMLLLEPRAALAETSAVRVYEQETVIPTYLAGEPEKSPMFFFGRQSQGAEGRIYPYPLFDTLTGKKVDRAYKLVFLENEFVRIGILPEIGGRVFEAVDKTNGYHFFYRQHVIKPALIGLIGAWISGGVEWNIPHHHRASTFLPVQYRIEEQGDGSKTVWVGELEIRHRMRWAVGYTLHPGRSYLEARVRIINRTPVVNTMLCFANAAVHATNDYQVIFPPRTQYVTHHHKRQFTTWPIATTSYGGHDFRPATDVSFYRNHQAANSMFAWNDSDDFFAGYDHGKHAGTMSVADHRFVPGKKLWTWGNGPRGRMWDKILSDDDGPYIELMVGAYSDNQPDYSWLQPFESKSFSMFWYPFREIGGVKKANLDAAVNLEVGDDGKIRLGFCATASRPRATVKLVAGSNTLFEENVEIGPGKPYLKVLAMTPGASPNDLHVTLIADGKNLLDYQPIKVDPRPMPEPDRRPPPPAEVKTSDELYLTGLRIEQFHDPDLEPDPYWDEALKRDPGDTRVLTAMGIRHFRRARYDDAEKHLRKALERLTRGYAAPKDGEATYYLGLTLKAQGRLDAADAVLGKATWSAAWQAAAFHEIAELASQRGDFPAALEALDRSLDSNARNPRTLNLKAAVERHLGHPQEAIQSIASARNVDPLDVRSLAEIWLINQTEDDARRLKNAMIEHPATALETAAEYQTAGLWEDGAAVLSLLANAPETGSRLSPLVLYDLAFFAGKLDRRREAQEARRRARELSADGVFPFQAELIPVLKDAMAKEPSDPRAPYYLGNLLFDWQPDEAVKLWRHSAELDPSFPMVHRNLAIAWSHRPENNNLETAAAELEKAVTLPGSSPIHLAELDELYQAIGKSPEQRLKMLEQYQQAVNSRAEVLSHEIALLVLAGRHDEAIKQMTARQFEVWEGGHLSVADDWVNAHVSRARQERAAGRFHEALASLEAAAQIPDNLPSDQGEDSERLAELSYERGLVHEAAGENAKARESWEKTASIRGRDHVFEALALARLGRAAEAKAIFEEHVKTAQRDLKAAGQIDPGASAETQQSQRDRLARAHYLASMGALGLGRGEEARKGLAECLANRPDHLRARTILQELNRAK